MMYMCQAKKDGGEPHTQRHSGGAAEGVEEEGEHARAEDDFLGVCVCVCVYEREGVCVWMGLWMSVHV